MYLRPRRIVSLICLAVAKVEEDVAVWAAVWEGTVVLLGTRDVAADGRTESSFLAYPGQLDYFLPGL